MARNDGVPQATEDAIVTRLLQRLQEKPGAYEATMAGLAPADRRNVENSVERHAARRRAAGEAGW